MGLKHKINKLRYAVKKCRSEWCINVPMPLNEDTDGAIMHLGPLEG